MSIDYNLFAFPKGKNLVEKKKTKDISKTNREEIKKLFKGKCGLCGKAKGVHIHHVVYKSEDKSKIDDIENLILLCLECHRKGAFEQEILATKINKNKK